MATYTQSKQPEASEGRSWYRKLFYDHPLYLGLKDPSSMANADKVKVWCKKCFEKRVEDELLLDMQRGGAVREIRDIEMTCEYFVPRMLRFADHRLLNSSMEFA